MQNHEKVFNVTPPNMKKGSSKMRAMPSTEAHDPTHFPSVQPQPKPAFSPTPYPQGLISQNLAEMEEKLQGLNLDPFTQSWSFTTPPTSGMQSIDKD